MNLQKGINFLYGYYGIGYKYYNPGKNGYYDANLAKSKISKIPDNYRLGAVVIFLSKSYFSYQTNFDIGNSFNRYITKEEIADGFFLF